jgi:uncharacterized membrane protein YsdA (DUF1294 family)
MHARQDANEGQQRERALILRLFAIVGQSAGVWSGARMIQFNCRHPAAARGV